MQFLETLTVRRSKSGIVWASAFVLLSSLLIIFSAAMNAPEFNFGRIIYVICFLNIAVLPYFFMDKTKGKYLLILLFLPIYFILFCIGDLISVMGFEEKAVKETAQIQMAVDLIILLGLFMYILGYLLIAKMGGKNQRGWFYYEWDYKKIAIVGFGCWIIGTWAFIKVIFLVDEGSFLPLSIVSNLKLLSILGVLMLVYLYTTTKSKSARNLLIAIAIFEFVMGFWANTKEVAFTTPLLYFLMTFMSKGRVKFVYLIVLILVMITFTRFFNVYRLFVIQIPDQTPIEALMDAPNSIKTVLSNLNTNHVDNKTPAATYLKERVETRKYIVTLYVGIENGVRTMEGYTLTLFFKSFVPRMFWPEKPVISTGSLFNLEFKISASELTLIPATHLGEFYWNYKLPGVIVGMFFIGMIMAYISKMNNLSYKVTLPRLLVIMMAIYIIVVRFETGLAQQYSLFVRALAAVWFLNIFMARKTKPGISQQVSV